MAAAAQAENTRLQHSLSRISRLATIFPHTWLFANFWHHQPPESLHDLQAVANNCAKHGRAVTYQVGLSTNKRKSDYSRDDSKSQPDVDAQLHVGFYENNAGGNR